MACAAVATPRVCRCNLTNQKKKKKKKIRQITTFYMNIVNRPIVDTSVVVLYVLCLGV